MMNRFPFNLSNSSSPWMSQRERKSFLKICSMKLCGKKPEKRFGSIMFVGQRWDNLIKEMSGGEAAQRTQKPKKPQAFIIAFSRQWVSGPFDSHDCWLQDEQKTKKKKREISNITAIHHPTAWRWVKWKKLFVSWMERVLRGSWAAMMGI